MAGSRGKRIVGVTLFIVAALAVAWFVFLLFADAENINDVPLVDEVPTTALVTAILLAVIALLLILLLVMRRWDRQEEEVEEAQVFYIPEEQRSGRVLEKGVPAHELDPVVPHDLRKVPLGARAWGDAKANSSGNLHTFHFPRPAYRAVYANDYIDIGRGDHLRLRTLLAAPPTAFRGAVEERPARPSIQEERDEAEPAPPRVRYAPPARDSDDFVQELESRYQQRQREQAQVPAAATVQVSKPQSYYDYTGDVHDVIDVEGIGPTYTEKLQRIGIHTTARLCFEEAGMVADALGVARRTVQTWQAMAELMKVKGIGAQYAEALARAGIEGIAELKKRSAQAIADQVNTYLDGLRVNVLGQAVSAKRVESWQEAAKPMRRVKMQIPEK